MDPVGVAPTLPQDTIPRVGPGGPQISLTGLRRCSDPQYPPRDDTLSRTPGP